MWPTAAFAYSFTMPTVLQFRWVGRGVREGRGGPRENSRIPARLTALDYRVFGVPVVHQLRGLVFSEI